MKRLFFAMMLLVVGMVSAQAENIMVLTRPGYKAENPNVNTDNCVFVEVPDIDISSSKIREMVKNGEDISQLVPKEVEEYIKEHNLYK